MIEYIKAQNKTNEAIVNNAFGADELHRFSKADFRWADNREKRFQTRTIKKEKYISLNLVKIICQRCHMSIED